MVEELGHFRKADPAVVDDDPFWSVVRRRHPDVDLVLLPGPDPDDDPQEPSDPETARGVVVDVLAAWRLIAPLVVALDPALGPPTVRWDLRDGGHALVLQKALLGLDEDHRTMLMYDVAIGLGGAGWRMRSTSPQGHRLLEVTDGRTHVRAEAGPGATVVRVASSRLVASEHERARLAAQAREAVASWR